MNNDPRTSASPTKSECRTRAQRERILKAAEKCFVNKGFHAASMSTIAETARMSPGLIYRYFSSKNEIILAIIQQQLELVREEMSQLDGSVDLPLEILKSFGRADNEDEQHLKPALFLEMSAEASRDRTIADAVRNSDRTLRTEFCEWLSRSPDKAGFGLPQERSAEVALTLQLIVEGMKVRELREPDLDRDLLRRALDTVLAPLLNR